VRRIAAATDGSVTAGRAVSWAAEMAERYGAELALVQVLLPAAELDGDEARDGLAARRRELAALAESLAGARGSAHLTVDADPAGAIVRVAQEQDADVLVVGNVAMRGRKEFLLGNVPNRVSHQAHCTVVIVNTALDEGPAAPAGDADGETADGELLARTAMIAKVMARHGLRGLFSGRARSERGQAKRLREALEELGPTFAKLGQILSTRPDLISPELVEELSTLQDRCAPLTEAEVVAVMERELGVPWEDVFESIDPEPLAAGTIAQVHRATLADGARVVIKVQRPTAEHDIAQDLGLLELFARKAEGRQSFRRVVDVPAIIDHLSSSLRRELDFGREAHNIERLREVLRPYPRLAVPGVHHDISSRRLLVMEEVQGGPIREAPQGQARREAARQLLESYYRQILTDGFFHADPHPGNLMWWEDRIYFLDLGMVGELEPDVRELLLLVLLAFAEDDPGFLAEVILTLAGPTVPADIDSDTFGRDVAALLEQQQQTALSEMALAPILEGMTEIALRHGVPLPASLALTGKAFAQMQLATAELDPELDAFQVAGEFVLRTVTGELRARTSPRRLLYDAQKLRLRMVRFMESIERVTGSRPGPGMQMEFIGVDRVEQAVHRAGRRVAVAMVAASALLASAVVYSVRGDGRR
jgi:ubiquinone biosynthesis protein